MSVYKRGKVWWICYGYRGKVYRESSGSTRKKDARALERKRLAELTQGRIGADAERVTFEDLAAMVEDSYRINGHRSLDRLLIALTHLRDYLGDLHALDITADRLRAYVVARQGEGAANATIKYELAALRRGFSLAVEADQLAHRPTFPTIRVDNVRDRVPTMADVEAICTEIGPDLAPLVRFAAFTGWRKRKEIYLLRWADVDFDARSISLPPERSKNREGRLLPFGTFPQLEALLREQRTQTDAVERGRGMIVPWVFHRQGEPIRSIRGAWKGACKRAGLEGFWFHDLRRLAVVNMERAGVPRSVAMKVSGHKTEDVYRRYAIADQAAIADGLAKLARLHGDAQRDARQVIPISAR